MDERHFDEWNELKKQLNQVCRMPAIKEGEIWWCAMGENIGIEINGKSKVFSRPVLIFRKLSRYGFLGVPLTSQPHQGSWYASFEFKDKTQVANLAQVRVLSVSRLYERIGVVPNSDFEIVRDGFRKLYH